MFARIKEWYRLWKLRRLVNRRVLPLRGLLDSNFHACHHEIRVPVERYDDLGEEAEDMVRHILINYMRPDGCTLHVCRRCYCLTASRVERKPVK